MGMHGREAAGGSGRKVLVLEKCPVVDGNVRYECVDGAPWEEKQLW